MRVLVGVCLGLGLLTGCSSSKEAGAPFAKASTVQPASDKAFVLQGTKGLIHLGDTLEAAQKAWPCPKNGHSSTDARNFQPLGLSAWGWTIDDASAKDAGTSFEVCVRDGKVAGASHVLVESDADKRATIVRARIEAFGAPSRKAESPANNAYCWERGSDLRFLIDMRVPTGTRMLIDLLGTKEDLAKLNYSPDKVEEIVSRLNDLGR